MASISDLKDITVEGGYFATKRTFPILANKINVVFGRNGSGKSSLSRAVLQYKNGKGCEFSDVHFNVELDDDVKEHIYVFNENFVREQMQVAPDGTRRDKLGTIVMYGRQIADSGELERARAEYEAKKSERDRMSAEKERLTLRQGELENSILKSLKKEGAYSSLQCCKVWRKEKRTCRMRLYSLMILSPVMMQTIGSAHCPFLNGNCSLC